MSGRDRPAVRGDAREAIRKRAERGKEKEDKNREKVIIPTPEEWVEQQLKNAFQFCLALPSAPATGLYLSAEYSPAW